MFTNRIASYYSPGKVLIEAVLVVEVLNRLSVDIMNKQGD